MQISENIIYNNWKEKGKRMNFKHKRSFTVNIFQSDGNNSEGKRKREKECCSVYSSRNEGDEAYSVKSY